MRTPSLPLLFALSVCAAYRVQAQGPAATVVIQQTPAVAHPLDDVTLSAAVQGAPAGTTFTYQWKHRGLAIPGATLSSHLIPRILSRDLGTYECDIVATKGTNTAHLTGAADCDCDYPDIVTVVESAGEITIIGTDGDDDVALGRLPGQLKVTVTPSGGGQQDYRIDTFTCCGVIPRRVTLDLGDGLDFLECDLPLVDGMPSDADLLGGGQPGDAVILEDMASFPNPVVVGFETVATGGAITGRVALNDGPAGTMLTDNLTPRSHVAVTFALDGGTQSPWSARFVCNDSGRFLGVLPPLPAGMATANAIASVAGTPLGWSSLSGGSLIGLASGPAPYAGAGLGLGVRALPGGPCAVFTAGREASLLIPFDEPESDIPSLNGDICMNWMDILNPAYRLYAPIFIPVGMARGARGFGGFSSSGAYEVRGASAVNPGVGSFTMACWMNRTSGLDHPSGVLRNQVVLDHATGTTGWRLGTDLGYLYLAMGNGALSSYTNSANRVPDDGVWHHIAVTVDRPGAGTGEVKFYIDGFQAGPPVVVPVAHNLDTPDPMIIGGSFYGGLDELEIHKSHALTPSEIQALWDAGERGRCAPVVIRHWKHVMAYSLATEFGIAATNLTNPVVIASLRDPFADSDGDSLPNRMEYAFGTDPLSLLSVPQITHSIVQPGGAGAPVLALTLRRSVVRAQVHQISARFTTDMTTWRPGSLTSSQPQTDGTVIETWTDPVSGPARAFGQLRESPVP